MKQTDWDTYYMRKPTDLNKLYPVDDVEHEIESFTQQLKVVLPILTVVFVIFFAMLLWLG